MTTVADAVIKIGAEGATAAQKELAATGSAIAALGAAAAAVAAAGLAALGAALVFSVNEALEAQNGLAQLDAVIKSTGGAAGVTADMATDLADSLSLVTRFSDDAILAGENMLLTFTNIGSEVFPEATKTILDMSQALGQDLKASAIQLGKALNDPITGVTALQRVGVTFTDSQKAMIKSMVEAGDVMGAQKVILAELNKEFGGSAESAGQTAAGQFEIFKNKLSEIGEQAGMILLPVMGKVLEIVGPALLTALESTLPSLQKFADLFSRLIDLAMVGVSPLTLFKIAMENLLSPEANEQLNTFISDMSTRFGPAFETILANLNMIGTQLGIFWQAHGSEILDAVSFTFGAVAGVIAAALQLITGIVSALLTGLNGNWGTAMDMLENAANGALASIVGIFSDGSNQSVAVMSGLGQQLAIIFDGIKSFIPQKVAEAILAATTAAKQSVKIGAALIQGITDAVMAGAGALIAALVGAVMSAIDAAKAAAGVASPSKVTMKELGAPLAQGVIGGWQNDMRSFGSVMSASIGGAMSNAAGLLSGSQSGGNTTNQSNEVNMYGPISQQFAGDRQTADAWLQTMADLGTTA